MKAIRLVVSFVALSAFVGCKPPLSTNPSDYVGQYVFTPRMQVPHEFAAFLILANDHDAIEIMSNGSVPISTTTEVWHLDHGTSEEVVIGRRAYPIERTRSTIRLIINGDLGQQYEKIR